MYRRLNAFLLLLLATTSFAAPSLNRDLARKRISELASTNLAADAIEIREITLEPPGSAIVESTVTLAFQFKKTDAGAWTVDAIRLGDRDWVNMSELLAAIYHGNPPAVSATPSIVPKPITPIEALHVNQSAFERERE